MPVQHPSPEPAEPPTREPLLARLANWDFLLQIILLVVILGLMIGYWLRSA